jgi:hypothetical protein
MGSGQADRSPANRCSQVGLVKRAGGFGVLKDRISEMRPVDCGAWKLVGARCPRNRQPPSLTESRVDAEGSRDGVRAARKRHGHVGSDDERAHELLADVGQDAAHALIRCKDDELRKTVAAPAHERGAAAWDGSLAVFLSALDPVPGTMGCEPPWARPVCHRLDTRNRRVASSGEKCRRAISIGRRWGRRSPALSVGPTYVKTAGWFFSSAFTLAVRASARKRFSFFGFPNSATYVP